MIVGLHVCMHTMCVPVALRGQRGCHIPWNLGDWHLWATILSSEGAASALICWAITPAPEVITLGHIWKVVMIPTGYRDWSTDVFGGERVLVCVLQLFLLSLKACPKYFFSWAFSGCSERAKSDFLGPLYVIKSLHFSLAWSHCFVVIGLWWCHGGLKLRLSFIH